MSSKKTGETQRDEHLESYNLKGVLPFGLDGSTARSILVDSSGRLLTAEGISLPIYDYVSNASTATSDTYTFKTGGSGGTTVATVAIVYTDSTKDVISTITKT